MPLGLPGCPDGTSNVPRSERTERHLLDTQCPSLFAAWDLANLFYDILEERNYNPLRCEAYGNGWNGSFTSYLLGQYFAGVHIIREMTHFLAYIRGEQAETLKRLLWKIQDEFVSMNYEGRESLEMRWVERHILAAQERLTEACDHDGDGTTGELRTLSWVEFQKLYGSEESGLREIFESYETHFHRIVYRRFKHLYSTKWEGQRNPHPKNQSEEELIKKEQVERSKHRYCDTRPSGPASPAPSRRPRSCVG